MSHGQRMPLTSYVASRLKNISLELLQNGGGVKLVSRVFGVFEAVKGPVFLLLLLVKEESLHEGFGLLRFGVQQMPVVTLVVHLPVVGQREDQLLSAPHPKTCGGRQQISNVHIA